MLRNIYNYFNCDFIRQQLRKKSRLTDRAGKSYGKTVNVVMVVPILSIPRVMPSPLIIELAITGQDLCRSPPMTPAHVYFTAVRELVIAS
jgi:hypothetical protein